MKWFFLITVYLVIDVELLFGQSSSFRARNFLSGYSTGMADVFSFTANPAALSHVKEHGIGIQAENKYSIKELRESSIAYTRAINRSAIGLSCHYSGDGYFRNYDYGLSYGKALTPKLGLGVGASYNIQQVEGYKKESDVNGDIGMYLQLSPGFFVGISVANFWRSRKEDESMQQYANYALGLGYELSEKLLIGAELTRESDAPSTLYAGLHYAVTKQVVFRATIMTSTGSYMGAVAFRWRNLRLECSTNYHPQLGFSPALQLTFLTPKREEHE